MASKKQLVAFSLGIIIIICGYLFISRDKENKPASYNENPKSGEKVIPRAPGLEFKALRLAGSNKGKKQWELWARSVSTNDLTKIAQVKGLEKVSVYRGGKLYLNGSADLGTYNLDTKDIEISGSIVLKNDKGDSFKTSKGHWISATEMLEIPAAISMSLDGRDVTADMAHVDIKNETVIAEGNVIIRGPNETIKGSRMIYNFKDESLSLEGYTSIDMGI